MFHIRIWILLSCFMLAACKNTLSFTPKNSYLPEATVDKPYRQVIRLYASSKLMYIKVKTFPDNTGLHWQYSRTDSAYWHENEEIKGNVIEITGIPVENPQKEIKISIRGVTFGTMWPGADAYKEYIIKLVPNSANSETIP